MLRPVRLARGPEQDRQRLEAGPARWIHQAQHRRHFSFDSIRRCGFALPSTTSLETSRWECPDQNDRLAETRQERPPEPRRGWRPAECLHCGTNDQRAAHTAGPSRPTPMQIRPSIARQDSGCLSRFPGKTCHAPLVVTLWRNIGRDSYFFIPQTPDLSTFGRSRPGTA